MKVISYQSLFYITVFCAGSQIYSLDLINRKYQEWMLGTAVQEKIASYLQDKDKCSLLSKPEFARVLVENNYQAPWWVKIGRSVPVKESTFSYAFDIYTVIKNVLDVVFDSLKKINNQVSQDVLWDLHVKKRDLETQLNIVINSPTEDIEITQNDVQEYINQAVKILKYANNTVSSINLTEPSLLQLLKQKPEDQKTTSEWLVAQNKDLVNKKDEFRQKQEKIQDVKKIFTNGIELLEALKNKPRMSLIERWHRNKQLERFTAYVDRYCR